MLASELTVPSLQGAESAFIEILYLVVTSLLLVQDMYSSVLEL